MEKSDLRKIIFELLVSKDNMEVAPLNPEIVNALRTIGQPLKDLESKLDVTKFVFLEVMSKKQNIIELEQFSKNKSLFEMKHKLYGTIITFHMQFDVWPLFKVIDVTLVTEWRNAYVKIHFDKIPEAQVFMSSEIERTIFIADAVTAIIDSFNYSILNKLDEGILSIFSNPTSNSGSGSSTPGDQFYGVYLA